MSTSIGNQSNTVNTIQLENTSLNMESSDQLRVSSTSVPLLSNASAQATHAIPVCTAINTYNTGSISSNATSILPLTSHSNIVTYSPTLTCHPPTLAYQTFVPHPSFVSHPNLNPYSGVGSQQTVSQCRVNSASSPGMSVLSPPHSTLMQLAPSNHSQHVRLETASIVPQQLPLVQILQQESVSKQSHLQPGLQLHNTDESSATHADQDNNCSEEVSSSPGNCFVCNDVIEGSSSSISLSISMPHSHAPLLVLLADVLGYNLANQATLHSKVVCWSCYQLLERLDEVQLTQTKNKTDVRRRFHNTIQTKGLSYNRQEKVWRGPCRRCGSVRPRITAIMPRKKLLPRGKRSKDNNTQQSGTTLQGAPDSNVNDLNKVKCAEAADKPALTDLSSSKASVSTTVLPSVTSSKPEPLSPGSTIVNSSSSLTAGPPGSNDCIDDRGGALVRIYDTDSAIFSGEERLKVGVMRRDSLNDGCKYQCHYCPHACDSAIALKMHVRLKHMPVLVYDNSRQSLHNNNTTTNGVTNDASQDGGDLEGNLSRLKMGIRLQNISSDHSSFNEKPFVCLFCECSYKLQCSLQSHFRDQHSPHKPFQCPSCEENFRRNVDLTRHKIYLCVHRSGQKQKTSLQCSKS